MEAVFKKRRKAMRRMVCGECDGSVSVGTDWRFWQNKSGARTKNEASATPI
ncbi:MAG: hypothetical protein IJV72_05110 [Clostridia bacterium]|nr:hypothetical protein [Clostridia bacterium]